MLYSADIRLKRIHMFNEFCPGDRLSVFPGSPTLAPNQFGLRDDQITEMVAGRVFHFKFDSRVLDFHRYREVLDLNLHHTLHRIVNRCLFTIYHLLSRSV